jgi:hypothetical protein
MHMLTLYQAQLWFKSLDDASKARGDLIHVAAVNLRQAVTLAEAAARMMFIGDSSNARVDGVLIVNASFEVSRISSIGEVAVA